MTSMHRDSAVPHDDDRSSVRMKLAHLMLRRGDDLADIAQRTAVPVPLLELMRDERDNPGPRPGSGPRDGRRHRVARRRPGGGDSSLTMRMIVMVVIIDFVAFCNITVCVTALVEHHRAWGATTGAIALGLIIAVSRLIRSARRRRDTAS